MKNIFACIYYKRYFLHLIFTKTIVQRSEPDFVQSAFVFKTRFTKINISSAGELIVFTTQYSVVIQIRKRDISKKQRLILGAHTCSYRSRQPNKLNLKCVSRITQLEIIWEFTRAIVDRQRRKCRVILWMLLLLPETLELDE